MKRAAIVLIALALALTTAVTVFADSSNVTYSGNAGEFIFAPGSTYSPTDLFPDFKDVMPGDSITQTVTVGNDLSKNVKVKIYMRSLGAHADSQAFLSQLHLRVQKAADNETAYMFDAAADETAGLTDWVCLGTLYSGGEVDLNVILDVPTTLDNDFKNLVGYLDWQFMVEELPVEPGDPSLPQTGDKFDPGLWLTLLAVAGSMLMLLLLFRLRKKEK